MYIAEMSEVNFCYFTKMEHNNILIRVTVLLQLLFFYSIGNYKKLNLWITLNNIQLKVMHNSQWGGI
ncbi:hypothetical protein UT300018_21580 [Clostridium faecium]